MAIFLIGVVIGMMGSFSVNAQSDETIYRLQSLFIYNFTKHIKWDTGESGPFTVGIYASTSQTSYKSIKQNLENKLAWGEKINVISIKTASEAAKCHIVYIPKLNDKKASEFISQMDPVNILLVTEDDLIDKGAAISFVRINSKLKFKINKMKVEQSGLKVSSSLLAVGIAV